MDIDNTELIDIEGEEEEFSSGKLDYPAMTVMERSLHFNVKCSGFLTSDRVQVSKTKDYLIFRDVKPNSRSSFSRIKRYSGFMIACGIIARECGLRTGQVFRVYKVKGGGCAVRRFEPESL